MGRVLTTVAIGAGVIVTAWGAHKLWKYVSVQLARKMVILEVRTCLRGVATALVSILHSSVNALICIGCAQYRAAMVPSEQTLLTLKEEFIKQVRIWLGCLGPGTSQILTCMDGSMCLHWRSMTRHVLYASPSTAVKQQAHIGASSVQATCARVSYLQCRTSQFYPAQQHAAHCAEALHCAVACDLFC